MSTEELVPFQRSRYVALVVDDLAVGTQDRDAAQTVLDGGANPAQHVISGDVRPCRSFGMGLLQSLTDLRTLQQAVPTVRCPTFGIACPDCGLGRIQIA